MLVCALVGVVGSSVSGDDDAVLDSWRLPTGTLTVARPCVDLRIGVTCCRDSLAVYSRNVVIVFSVWNSGYGGSNSNNGGWLVVLTTRVVDCNSVDRR